MNLLNVLLFVNFIIICSKNANSYQYEYKEHNRYRPHLAKKFFGVLLEGERKVSLNPPLLATDDDAPENSGLICGYNLQAMNHGTINQPFVVSLLDKRNGRAEIFIKDDVALSACNNHGVYKFFISAFDCGTSTNKKRNTFDQRTSRKSKLYISIKEINKYDPYFVEWFYSLDVEGLIGSEQALVSLHAKDDDCGQKNGKICRFEVDDKMKKQFFVSDDGVLFSQAEVKSNTKKLFFNVSVTAHDCNGRKSLPAIVSIMIYPPCKAGLSGLQKKLILDSAETSTYLSPHASFTTCIPAKDIVSIQLTFTLDMYQVESDAGCDSKVSFDSKHHQVCSEYNSNLVKLLPDNFIYDELKQFSFSNFKLPTLKIANSFSFNGKDQVFQPTNGMLFNYNLSDPFSVFFKIRLSSSYEHSLKRKSTILCKSDVKGRKGRYEQFFNGELTMLVVYLDKLKDVNILSCAEGCEEGIATMNEDGTMTSFSSRLQLLSDGNDVEALVKKSRKVFYFNKKPRLISESRKILVETRIICTSAANVCPYSPPFELTVSVSHPSNSLIILAGKTEIFVKSEDFKQHNFHPFVELFLSLKDNLISNQQVQTNVRYFDACYIVVSSRVQSGTFEFPLSNLYKIFLLENFKNGVLIRGRNSVKSYQDILRSIVYHSKVSEVEDYKILFKLQCHNWKERFSTNTYVLAMFVSITPRAGFFPAEIPKINPLLSHPAALPSPAGIIAGPSNVLMRGGIQSGNSISDFSSETNYGRGDSVIAVIVGCSIGFFVLIVFMVVVVRFQLCLPDDDELIVDEGGADDVKDAGGPDVEQEEMDWDDSAVTITINPMEARSQYENSERINTSDGETSGVDDDGFMSDQDAGNHESRHEELM